MSTLTLTRRVSLGEVAAVKNVCGDVAKICGLMMSRVEGDATHVSKKAGLICTNKGLTKQIGVRFTLY